MKSTILFAATVLFFLNHALTAFSQEAKQPKEMGIEFFEGTWDEALAKAKKEKKLIFLDIYATWCGPCKRLAAITFPDENVGKYYNKHFINVRLDGEKGEGKVLAQRYGVRSYPSLLFLDHAGAVVHFTAGFRDPERFIELGQMVMRSVQEKK